MNFLHSGLFVIHVLFGSAALLLLWFPIYSKKGSAEHKRFGRYYTSSMYMVAISGALMATLVLLFPVEIYGAKYNITAENAAEFSQKIRVFFWFLLYLSLLTATSLRHGLLVLEGKRDKTSVKVPLHLAMLVAMVLGGPMLFALGWVNEQKLPMIFGTLGTILGLNMLRYSLSDEVTPNGWLIEHLSALGGTGIGAYTAFFAFGGRTLLQNFGDFQLFFWIAPGVIGSIAISWASRKYSGPKQLKQKESTV